MEDYEVSLSVGSMSVVFWLENSHVLGFVVLNSDGGYFSSGSLRFDGCINFNIGDEKCRGHVCGPDGWADVFAAFNMLYSIAAEVLESVQFDRDDFATFCTVR